MCASHPSIRSQPRFRKAFPRFFTGVCGWVFCAKNWQLLTEAVPAAKRIAVLLNPADPVTVPQIQDTERAAPKLSVEIRFFPVREPGELPATFTAHA